MEVAVVIGVVLAGLALVVLVVVANRPRPRHLTVLVCGATGVGKSTLINSIAERQAALTGIGAPVTQNTTRIEVPTKQLVFYDSKGLEVEEASQTYLLLLSDILSLRYNPKVKQHIDVLLMCIQEPQGRIDDAHREIAGLCEDVKIPYGIAITKTFGDDALYREARLAFPNAKFVRKVRSLPVKLPGLEQALPTEGLGELLDDLRASAIWDGAAALRRAGSSVKAASLSSSARALAASGGKSDLSWIQFAAAASSLIDMSSESWEALKVSMRDDIRKQMVTGFFQRVFLTKFDHTKIDGAIARRLVPIFIRRFADQSMALSYEDRAQARREASELLSTDRPYRGRFD